MAGVRAGHRRGAAGGAMRGALCAALVLAGILIHVRLEGVAAMDGRDCRMEFAVGVHRNGVERDWRLLPLRQCPSA